MAAVPRGAIILLVLAVTAPRAAADPVVPVPRDLPRYDLTLTIDVPNHIVRFRQVITWTNRHQRPSDTIALNFYPHYVIPKGDRLLLAKTLELLRLDPEIGIDPNGRHGHIARVSLGGPAGQLLPFSYREDNPTEFVIDLPRPVRCGESVTIELEGSIRLPHKHGRWGQWEGVTFLTHALPLLAYYDDRGWHPTPFVPWHQPFWNEAGVYTASITLPADQKLACSAAVAAEQDCGNGWRTVVTKPFVGRDFALTCSGLYQEFGTITRLPDGRDVAVKCYAFPRHAFYAQEMVRIVAEALPVYSEWFGPYPYDQFTVAESFFGWNGNEQSGMILIDERVFDMPKLARGYVEYLVSHETCHQWFYNQVGTNGSAETFMDEGIVVHFTHRLLDARWGRNNAMLDWPTPWGFMPTIRREDYRWGSWYGAVRREDAPPAGLPLSEFGSLVRTFSGAYDRGSKVFGMIEARLGPDFLPFIRGLVQKYSFRILLAADLKAELVAFTGQPAYWDEFFAKWVYSDVLTDWKVESVRVDDRRARRVGPVLRTTQPDGVHEVEVVVSQNREVTEPTVIGFQLTEGDGYAVRVPVGPVGGPVPGCDATVEPLGDHRYRVRTTLPVAPVQVTVDPDRVLLDAEPGNNSWRRPWSVDVIPLYSVLSDTDLTRPLDRWSLVAGPWFWGPTYLDPWYTRSFMIGARVGAYRTQTFQGGAYVAYRTNYRDIVAGLDGLIDHWPGPKNQVGFLYERRLAGPLGGTNGRDTADRVAVYGRYIFQYSSSLYLHPMHYIEAFASYQDNFLPFARTAAPGAIRPGWTQLNGLHYRLNLYTPYWDPDQGVWVDAVAAGGVADLGPEMGTAQLRGELAAVRKLPECWGYLSEVKAAGRVVVQGAWPDEGQFYALGGGQLFRGFDLAQRQGSFLWVANAELRFPVMQHLHVNTLDSILGLRNVWVAGFYDVGSVYVNDRSVGGVAHALGAGLRLDVAIFSFLERATVRLDAAKTINAATPVQFWFGVQHPF